MRGLCLRRLAVTVALALVLAWIIPYGHAQNGGEHVPPFDPSKPFTAERAAPADMHMQWTLYCSEPLSTPTLPDRREQDTAYRHCMLEILFRSQIDTQSLASFERILALTDSTVARLPAMVMNYRIVLGSPGGDVTPELNWVGRRACKSSSEVARQNAAITSEATVISKPSCVESRSPPPLARRRFAQRPVVHIERMSPDDAPRVDIERVAPMHVVVEHRREQIMRRSDRVKIAGEMQVDLLHRRDLRAPAARRPTLLPEARAPARARAGR